MQLNPKLQINLLAKALDQKVVLQTYQLQKQLKNNQLLNQMKWSHALKN